MTVIAMCYGIIILVACFDPGVNEGLVKELARFEPLRVVFRRIIWRHIVACRSARTLFSSVVYHPFPVYYQPEYLWI
jgi:hypothetical protein